MQAEAGLFNSLLHLNPKRPRTKVYVASQCLHCRRPHCPSACQQHLIVLTQSSEFLVTLSFVTSLKRKYTTVNAFPLHFWEVPS